MARMFAALSTDPGLTLLLSLSVRSVVVLLFAGLLVGIPGRRASAATRATMVVTAMVALLLLPICSHLTPDWRVAVLPAPAANVVDILPAHTEVFSAPTVSATSMAAPLSAQGTHPAMSVAAAPAPFRVSVLIFLWALGAMGYGCWLLLGRVRLLTLAARCPVVSSGPLIEMVTELAAHVGVRSSVIVRQAPIDPSGAITPMTWGWLRPTLLLPTEVLESWPEKRTRAVLLHELAHIARRDWLTQSVLQFACALYWFNPLVWRTATLWEREAEQACDDRVLLAGIAAPDYAAHLLEVVRSLRALHPVVSQGSAHTMAAPRSNVQMRLIAILEERRNRRQTSFKAGFSMTALAVLLLLPIAALRLTTQAQAEPIVQADAETLLMNATERSWRGEWDRATQLAERALQQKGLDDLDRSSAYWLLFEAAWWKGDSATENKNYTLFKEIAVKHPDNQELQVNLQIADRYRSGFNPQKQSATLLIAAIEELITQQAYADGLHYAKYLLGRPGLPQEIRGRALLAAYQGAHQCGFADSVASLDKQFHSEITTLPEAVRNPLQAQFLKAQAENPQADKTPEGPLNLDFAHGLDSWANDNPEHDAARLYTIGTDPKGRREGKPSAFLTSKGGDPKHYGTLMQNFVQPDLKGKRVRYSAYLKTEGVTQGAGLWIVLFGANHDNHGGNMTQSPLRGTTGWKKVEWVFDVPENNTGFSFGIDLTGNGKVWIDDFRFEVVDKSTPVSPGFH